MIFVILLRNVKTKKAVEIINSFLNCIVKPLFMQVFRLCIRMKQFLYLLFQPFR